MQGLAINLPPYFHPDDGLGGPETAPKPEVLPPGVRKPHDDSGLGPAPAPEVLPPGVGKPHDDSGLGPKPEVLPPSVPTPLPPMEDDSMEWWVILLVVIAFLLLIAAGYALAATKFNLKWHKIITDMKLPKLKMP